MLEFEGTFHTAPQRHQLALALRTPQSWRRETQMSTESGDGFLWRWWKQPKRESGERLTPRGLPILKGSEFGAPSDGKCYLYCAYDSKNPKYLD